jgi:hypothetical protein
MNPIGRLFKLDWLFRPFNRTEKTTAVIDRFETTASGQKLAVLLVGKNERTMDVPVSRLPANIKEGDWLDVTLKNDKLTEAKVNKEATDAARERIQGMMKDLFEDAAPKKNNAF